MYEKKNEDLLSRRRFIWRLTWHVLAAILLLIITLIIGALGHIYFEGIPFHDAFLNTALIVGGIGTTVIPESVAGKIFFSVYGMFIGLVFAAVVGVSLAPVIHRIMHHMHLDEDDDKED